MTTALNRRPSTNGVSLRNAFDRLFEESFVHPLSTFGMTNGMSTLPLDLFETDESFVIRAFVPGVSPENLEITVQGTTLSIRAQQPVEQQEGVRYILRERLGNTWFRSLELPGTFDADHVEAKLENGVLYLNLPKTPESKPHRISINANH
jgi:HSP20 family protein